MSQRQAHLRAKYICLQDVIKNIQLTLDYIIQKNCNGKHYNTKL